MPESAMTHAQDFVTCETDVSSQIKALMECMDTVDHVPDGFSDSDDSSGDEDGDSVHVPVSGDTHDHLETEKRLAQSLGLKNGLFDRSVPREIHRHISKHSDQNHETGHINHKSVKGSEHLHCDKHAHNHNTSTSNHHKQHYHQLRHHHYQHHHHSHQDSTHFDNHTDNNQNCVNNDSNPDTASGKQIDETDKGGDCDEPLTDETLAILRAGQSVEDVDEPIMSPPTTPEVKLEVPRCSSAYYSRPMSLKFLLIGEKISCSFNLETARSTNKELLSSLVRATSPVCYCVSASSSQEAFCGWVPSRKPGRVKTAKRRRNGRHADSSLSKLNQTTSKDPVIFQHYKDTSKYIERYRFFHTVGNVSRPFSYTSYDDKGNDPYIRRVKSNLSAMNSQIFNLASQMRDDNAGSASSEDDAQDKPRSDDESNEESSVDVRTCSMRDRGKALNLAPVREYTVPCCKQTDKLDMVQLNKYLNLSTPPMHSECLDYRFISDNGMVAVNGSRRRTRTLRLGSAEFVKPGVVTDSSAKWNGDKRPAQKSATHTASSVPGNLIVGSTVSSLPFQAPRARSGSLMPSYSHSSQKDNGFSKNSPLQQVSGHRVKTSERLVSEISSSGKERGKFGYTHGESNEKPFEKVDKVAPPLRTATAIDFRESYVPRHHRSRTLTLDMNNLGIRGQTFKQSEQMALYKNRRAQSLRS